MLAVLANETSAIIQFRLTQFLCYISPEERIAVEVKTNSNVDSVLKTDKFDIIADNCEKANLFNLLFAENSTQVIVSTRPNYQILYLAPKHDLVCHVLAVLNKPKSRKRTAVGMDKSKKFRKQLDISQEQNFQDM